MLSDRILSIGEGWAERISIVLAVRRHHEEVTCDEGYHFNKAGGE